MEILRCENLNKVYGSGDNRVVALEQINIAVNKGEFVAIVRRPLGGGGILSFRFFLFPLTGVEEEIIIKSAKLTTES